jgi:hypothetical protein
MAINFVFRVCLLIALILTLSGCFGLGGAALLGVTTGTEEGPPPRVLCSTEDSIGVIYQEVNFRQDEAMQLTSEHCAGEYVEARRVNGVLYWRSVYAICLSVDGSPAVSQPCENTLLSLSKRTKGFNDV